MRGPTARFYFAPGYTWKTLDADIVWVEITSKVLLTEGASVSRGRSSELDDYRAGSCSFTLDNRGRLFDPTYASGTYFGDLKPGVPVKIEGVANSTTFPVFRGFIDGWPQDYELSDRQPVVSVSAVDGFGKLAQAGTTESVYAYEVGQDSPVANWRLDETAGVVMSDSSGNSHHGLYDNPELGQDPLVWGDGKAAMFQHVGDHRGIVRNVSLLSGYPFTFEAWVKFTRDTGALHTIIRAAHDQVSDGHRIELDCPNDGHASSNTDGALVMRISGDTVAAGRGVKGTTAIGDNIPHHVVGVVTDANTIDLYVDGVAETISTWAANAGVADLAKFRQWTVANLPDTAAGDFGLDGTIDEVAIYDTALDAGRVADHYAAGVSPWDGDTTGERIARLLDIAEWPADLLDLATGFTPLGAATLGQNLLFLIKRNEKAEQGRFFMSRSGDATFLDRYDYLTGSGMSVAATFSDDGADIPYSGFSYAYDTRVVYNRVRGSRTGGATVESFDQGSIDDYGEQVDSALDGIDAPTDGTVQALTEQRLLRYSEPQLRAQPIQVPLHGVTAAQQAAVLGLELAERVNIERTPNDTGSAVDQDGLIEGLAHQIGAGTWTTTLTTSPVDPTAYGLWDSGVWDTAVWSA